VVIGLDGGRGRVCGGASSNDVVEHRHRLAAPRHQYPLILPAERAVGEALDVLAIFAGGNVALLDDCDRVADGDSAAADERALEGCGWINELAVEVKVIGRIGGAHRVGELEDMLLTRHKAQANGVGLLLEGAVDRDELVGGLGVDIRVVVDCQ